MKGSSAPNTAAKLAPSGSTRDSVHVCACECVSVYWCRGFGHLPAGRGGSCPEAAPTVTPPLLAAPPFISPSCLSLLLFFLFLLFFFFFFIGGVGVRSRQTAVQTQTWAAHQRMRYFVPLLRLCEHVGPVRAPLPLPVMSSGFLKDGLMWAGAIVSPPPPAPPSATALPTQL